MLKYHKFEQRPQPHQHGKKGGVVCGEHEQVPDALFGKVAGYLLVGDEAGHGGYQRAQPAEVAAHDERVPAVGEPRKQQRGGHVAYYLAGEHRDGSLAAGDDGGEKIAEGADVAYVADKYEQCGKRAEQGIVHLCEHSPCRDQPEHQERRGDYERRYYVEQREHAQHEPDGRPYKAEDAAERRGGHPACDGRASETHDNGKQPYGGQRAVRQHGEHQLPERHPRLRIQIQVLRIAHRREHAAQVCGERLQYDERHGQPQAVREPEHHQRERHEGDERDVVGGDHAEKEWQKDEHKHYFAGASRCASICLMSNIKNYEL